VSVKGLDVQDIADLGDICTTYAEMTLWHDTCPNEEWRRTIERALSLLFTGIRNKIESLVYQYDDAPRRLPRKN